MKFEDIEQQAEVKTTPLAATNPIPEDIEVPGDIQLAFVRRFGQPPSDPALLTQEQIMWLNRELTERGLL